MRHAKTEKSQRKGCAVGLRGALPKKPYPKTKIALMKRRGGEYQISTAITPTETNHRPKAPPMTDITEIANSQQQIAESQIESQSLKHRSGTSDRKTRKRRSEASEEWNCVANKRHRRTHPMANRYNKRNPHQLGNWVVM